MSDVGKLVRAGGVRGWCEALARRAEGRRGG